MLKVYKRFSDYKRFLISCVYDLEKLKNGYIATYSNNNKLVYLCKTDSLFLLYFRGKLYFSCPSSMPDLMVDELSNLIILHGTNLTISTSF